MASNFEANSAKLAYLTFIHALAFQNGVKDRNSDLRDEMTTVSLHCVRIR